MNPRFSPRFSRRLARRLVAGLLIVAGPAGIITACGSSDDASNVTTAAASPAASPVATPATDAGSDAASDDTDLDLSDLTVPDNVSGECADLYQHFIEALSKAGSGEDFAGLQAAIASLSDSVPDDLKDDVAVLSDAYGKMADLVAANGGDIATAMANADVQAQLQAIGTEKVTAAGDAISDYFDTTCPELNQS
jgi:hypothetical protein